MTSRQHEVGLPGSRSPSVRPAVARAWGWLRLGVAALILAAVAATVADAAGRTSINPFNLFGYFTIQSNLLLAAVLVLLGARGVAGHARVQWAEAARAACVTYIVLVGVVYAVLLAPLGAAGGVPVRWANLVLHVVTPLYAVIDWLLAPGGRRLPLHRARGADDCLDRRPVLATRHPASRSTRVVIATVQSQACAQGVLVSDLGAEDVPELVQSGRVLVEHVRPSLHELFREPSPSAR